jgi:hypothetical protein
MVIDPIYKLAQDAEARCLRENFIQAVHNPSILVLIKIDQTG